VGQSVICKVIVRGTGPAPTGQVLFKTAGAGSFSGNPCSLPGGSGDSSVCTVSYRLAATGADQLTATYGGDGANSSVSTSFVIKGIP
jgi:hypothetical protein